MRSIAIYSLLLSSASAWQYPGVPTYGFGPSPAYNTSSYTSFLAAYRDPNVSVSAPLTLDGQTYTLEINITDFDPVGADTEILDPRVVNTAYTLSWDTGDDLSSTVATAENTDDPRLCVYLPMGTWSSSVTNKYKEDDGGDCSSVLGDKCTQALTGMGPGGSTGCTGFEVPDDCKSIWPDGGTASASVLNENMLSSPYGIAYWTSAILNNVSTAYERETERLHVVILSGVQTRPICLRATSDDISKGSPGAGVRVTADVAVGALVLVMGIFALIT